MDILPFIDLFKHLPHDEVLRIELITGGKIYCLPSDTLHVETAIIKITKPIKERQQIIIIDVNAIALVCTMSRETYDLKLQRGELYV